MIGRRGFIGAAGALLLPAAAAAQTPQAAGNQWYPVRGDEGQPVPNLRAPAELVEDIEDLKGAIWAGPQSGSVKLVEFYDYNCPWCRAAEKAREGIQRQRKDLRIGLVHNPILSLGSVQAAKVDLAVLKSRGAAASFALHTKLFSVPGRIDGPRALEAAAALGHDRAEIERIADSPEITEQLRAGTRLAASLGINATPSYVVGGAVVLGYPGPKTLTKLVADAATCGSIAC